MQDFLQKRDLLLSHIIPIDTETVPLLLSAGRVLAESVTACEDVPRFDRSAYDGYAFRAADIESASADTPITLRIIEEVPAGKLPTMAISTGTASKILTGAPIPKGADTVIQYEKTQFTATEVTLTCSLPAGSNIVRRGEDLCVGTPIAEAGILIDAGLSGLLASQGIASCCVHRRPVVGLIATGNEIIGTANPAFAGMTRDSNTAMLSAALLQHGFIPKHYGIVPDHADAIGSAIADALAECDALLITGGVSAGDYDVTPLAMEQAGCSMLFHGMHLKPGMACAYAMQGTKPVCALSGNPASALTNFYAVALPALKKLAGYADCLPKLFPATTAIPFKKHSPATRILRGTLDLADGTVRFCFAPYQGNAVLHSAVGCNTFAIIPAGSKPLPAGTTLLAFQI